MQLHVQAWSFETAQGWLYIVPDEAEHAATNRELAWISYRPPALLAERLQTEFVLQWQRHEIDYRIKDLPDGFTLDFGSSSVTQPTRR